MKLYTIGYEGWYIEDFVPYLKAKKVRRVVDVRKNPVSRKRGFSKNKLRDQLATVGIDYVHLGGTLGVPSVWRKAAKKDPAARKRMFERYDKTILAKAKPELKEILQLANKGGLALLCFERDAYDCHRSYVVKRLRKIATKFSVVDLEGSNATNSRSAIA